VTSEQLRELRQLWVTLNRQLITLRFVDQDESEDPKEDINEVVAGLSVVARGLQRFLDREENILRFGGREDHG
jgi:hypothetical protein